MQDNTNKTRINKYLSEAGYCSRRAADKLIDQGRVTINGEVPEMGTKITAGDIVKVDGELIKEPKGKSTYLAFNKPVGIVCTTDTGVEKDNIIDFINKILRARNNHEKEYLVTVDKPITIDFLNRMRKGIPILDTVTRECQVFEVSTYQFRIILTQGLNRQIRRMCEYLEYRVKKLKRIRIMNVQLDIPVGVEINRLVSSSSKTFDGEK